LRESTGLGETEAGSSVGDLIISGRELINAHDRKVSRAIMSF